MILLVAAATFHLASADVTAGHAIPAALRARQCGGENRSPALQWRGAPHGTTSFAVIVHDADAPVAGGFYHWVLYNLPVTAQGLTPNVKLATDQLGRNSTGAVGYFGPCPPPGPAHHYTFTIYALDIARLTAQTPLAGGELERRIAGHVLASASFKATASSR